MLTRPGLDVSLPRGVLVPLQLLAVLALADLSYRFVELPFRGQSKLPALPDGWLRVARPALIVSTLAIVALIGWSGLFSEDSDPPASAASTATTATVRASLDQAEGGDPSPGHSAERRPGDGSPPSVPPRIIALGDSVMIGAAEKLAARLGPGFSMSAEVGRQADEFVAIAQRLKREGRAPNAMIVQMGNNGPLYSDEMEDLRKATSEVGELFLIDDHAPVSWIGESNQALDEAARDWPHTALIDWAPVADAHENLLWDGIHLTPGGAGLYARLVSAAVHEMVAFPPPPSSKPRAEQPPAPERHSSKPRQAVAPARPVGV
jgi:hypothetical protein